MLKIIDNNNAGAPGIVRSPDDSILSTISVIAYKRANGSLIGTLVMYEPLIGG